MKNESSEGHFSSIISEYQAAHICDIVKLVHVALLCLLPFSNYSGGNLIRNESQHFTLHMKVRRLEEIMEYSGGTGHVNYTNAL